MLLLKIEEGKKRGLKVNDVIEGIITEDQDFYLDTLDPDTIKEFRRQRKEHYLQLLEKASNVTLLNEHVDGPFEHSFDRDCYQEKLKFILNNYQSKNS